MSASKGEVHAVVATSVSINGEALTLDLSDGRVIAVPIGWFPRLVHATSLEWSNWRWIGKGIGVHWPDLDEDISVESLLAGRKSNENAESLTRWLKNRGAKVQMGIRETTLVEGASKQGVLIPFNELVQRRHLQADQSQPRKQPGSERSTVGGNGGFGAMSDYL
jgi:hypothetical protein